MKKKEKRYKHDGRDLMLTLILEKLGIPFEDQYKEIEKLEDRIFKIVDEEK